ncbi:Type IV pilus biogenesis and competence protein PilQ [Aquicella siphonis]|uniref:Type IV pilus biogenesis and competence protein PilQ n=1 Tax=Aquicella siphonis TaxID=254247 RepID=A0A5E4PKZ1_9COXI|nr:type IV pilus secretin PilQ [Aquicella siphonis]VVC77067.1 Type IV pilus biogenesis and competence protein PilQ [Aquicella siphonis]
MSKRRENGWVISSFHCVMSLISAIIIFSFMMTAEGFAAAETSPVVIQPSTSGTAKVINVPLPQQPADSSDNNSSGPESRSLDPQVQGNAAQNGIKPLNGRVSFYFQNVPVKTLLQLIAKNSGLNFIISDDVKGNTTLNLKNVTWRQALDIILQSQGLSSRQIGTALFISTTEDIAQKQAKEYQAVQDAANLSPLSTAIIGLKYSDAAEIAKVLKSSEGSLLTPRGEISVNSPTNTIIVRDVKSNLSEVRRYIRRLDIPARQVSIEARIVNIDTSYEAQLGVRFGVSNTRSLSGTLSGANQLAQGIDVASVSPLSQRLNFDLPANLLSTGATPGSIGLALARLGPVLLDLELSALEEEGHTQIISKPRVVTANQQKAMIQTGEEIPYQQATSSGATSVEFKKAVLSLEIIPQITPDDKIILKLKATQDTRGPQLLVAQGADTTGTTTTTASLTTTPAVFGPPTINTQEVQSYVLLNDNETVVIGGVYKLTKSNTFDRVPFFGSLPIVGGLFRHRGIKNEKSELLIFLTPKIIKQQSRAMAYKGD